MPQSHNLTPAHLAQAAKPDAVDDDKVDPVVVPEATSPAPGATSPADVAS